jgi:hypothetical protein
MVVTESGIARLHQAYRDAHEAIGRESDPIEREIGRAAHRLEATQAYARLASFDWGPEDEQVASFGEFVASLSGAGELAERTVDLLDAGARESARTAMRVLTNALYQKALAAVAAFAIGVASGVWLAAQYVGAVLVPVALGAGLASFAWYAFKGFQLGLGWGWIRSWRWATRVGQRSDAAMAVARSLEESFWEAAGAVFPPSPLFTTRARRRAMVVVGLSWIAILLGIAAVISGFLIALDPSDVCIDDNELKAC